MTGGSRPRAPALAALHRRWLLWRNSWLSSSAFQQRALRLPLLDRVARQRSRALYDRMTGFVTAQVLVAFVETGMMAELARGIADAEALGTACGLAPDRAELLARAAASFGLAQPVAGGWTLGIHGAALAGNPGLATMIAHHRSFYADLADPVGLLRRPPGSGTLAAAWPYAADADAAAVAGYSQLMAATQPMVAAEVLDRVPLAGVRRLLDVGGGEGAFLEAVGARWPGIDRHLFDLPAVAERARARLGESAAVHGGSFLCDPLPGGFDCITLVRVLHDHDDAAVAAILARAHAALLPGGRLVIAEPMAGARGAESFGDAYFALYLLAMGRGRPRTAGEYRALAAAAGFADIRHPRSRAPLACQCVVARKR